MNIRAHAYNDSSTKGTRIAVVDTDTNDGEQFYSYGPIDTAKLKKLLNMTSDDCDCVVDQESLKLAKIKFPG